ncbi:MAG: hypothetical protein A3F18_01480 [Legionellales bacterium RIFCSPHIGHO2_12_FULL_37_14]|nr:MAG: hypothetical protein A3F18_01480 [Legionellales bacterium RIFCSPHIGHO2_12_FULL_37_14]
MSNHLTPLQNTNQKRVENLLRQEVKQKSAKEAIGSIFLEVQFAYELCIWLGVILATALGIWFYVGSYQEKAIVKGYLDLKPALLEVFPRSPGLLVKQWTYVGQKVKKGEVLFKVSSSIDGTKQEFTAHLNKLEQLIAKMEQDITIKRQRLKQFKQLLVKHYLSFSQYEAEKRQLRAKEQDIEQLKVQQIKSKISQSYVIMAPITGVVSEIAFQVGSYVDGRKSVLKIKPISAKWLAKLLIPVKQLRFVTPLTETFLRYDPYAYKRYGTVKGFITAETLHIAKPSSVSRAFNIEEPFYEVNVKLDKPYLYWRTFKLPIYHGMTLEAVLLGERRALWEWVWSKVG